MVLPLVMVHALHLQFPREERMQGAAASAEGKGGGDQSATKKPRLEPPPNVQVKQETIAHQATTGSGGGGGAMVAAEDGGSRVEVLVKIDKSVLHCPICFHPFKPPVFRCKGGHLACGSCLEEIPDKQCRKCEPPGAFERCPALEEVVSSAQIECAHDGCGSYVTYHEAGEHGSACPHAPCSCTEPGCGFQGAPAALLAHLAAQHAMPVHRVQRARVAKLLLPAAPERQLLLVEGDDSACFLLTVRGGPAGITAVSAVHIRAGGPPRYAVKMWANGPAPALGMEKADAVWVDIVATSSAAPGAVDVEELTSLGVPRKFLVGGAARAPKELPLNIRIAKC